MLAHNKTLAAQLYGEFKEFFPDNAVEYFVSYYDYYQPEAYVPSSDTYIEKDASINDHIEQMRLSATKALLERPDSIIVATVSSIYGLGDPQAYLSMVLHLSRGDRIDQRKLLHRLTDMQYTRNDVDLSQGTYRVRGDVVDIFPAESEREAVRVQLFDDEVESLHYFDPLTGEVTRKVPRLTVFPSSHYVTPRERLAAVLDDIKDELRGRLAELRAASKLVEAQRLEQRTLYDIEMMNEVGYCAGIENYSRHLSGRGAGRAAAVPLRLPAERRAAVRRREPRDRAAARRDVQGRPLAQGDAGRVRLPAAVGARQSPAQVRGVRKLAPQMIFVSATPGDLRARALPGAVVEQVIRPTGLIDPEVDVRPVRTQVDDLLSEIQVTRRARRARAGHDADQAHGRGPDRLPARPRRQGPLPALRHRHDRARRDHPRSAARQVRRARRHQPAARGPRPPGGVAGRDPRRRQGGLPALGALADPDDRPRGAQRHGRAILYADTITGSMRRAMDETARRRAKQVEYNLEHGITPVGIVKAVQDVMEGARSAEERGRRLDAAALEDLSPEQVMKRIRKLEAEMSKLARNLEFEAAAKVRDEISELRNAGLGLTGRRAG